MVSFIIVAIVAYLLGSISFSVIFTKKFKGFDVREKGSGNAGSTNVLRTAGVKVALLTLICDVLKGVIAVVFAMVVGKIAKVDNSTAAWLCTLAGILVVIGHTFPVFFGFKGGKGVATSLGVLLILNWQIGLICLVFALVVMALSRMVSLGSISAAVLYPVLCIFLKNNYIIMGEKTHYVYIISSIILAVIVIFNHRSNIERIFNGEENKLTFKK